MVADNLAMVAKGKIANCLSAFRSGALATTALNLLDTLGYRSDKTIELTSNTADGLLELVNRGDFFNREKARPEEWESIDFLFQLTDEEVRQHGQPSFAFDSKVVDVNSEKQMESFVFFAVHLKRDTYSRTTLADVTREINRLFPMPAIVLFRHGKTLTLSVIDRRLHKRDAARDVLEKVTLIKDIRVENPHRAHIEILFDLAFPQLASEYKITNFIDLHEAWRKTLDSSELNKRFYKELANWYFWALEHVEFPQQPGVSEEVNRATNVIRLITRFIFVWFLKERELVPEALFKRTELAGLLKDLTPESNTFYKAILQNLFFATLNTPMKDPKMPRKFRGKAKPGGRFDQHAGIDNVFRYEDYFKGGNATALQLFESIPFLNGGLFECLDKSDKEEGKKWKQNRLEKLVDGFSELKENPLNVPNKLFFCEEHDTTDDGIDLNEIYGTQSKRYPVRGLIDILSSYKFTIAENTPIEEEVALDPELLGRVFENLLASYNPETGASARKQTGSFYTPREIVNYMVDESLIAYLETQLTPLANNGEPDALPLQSRLHQLFAYTDEPHQFSETEVNRLIAAIDRVKILDPACGSGAFPMGVLHKLVFILAKLDPQNERWKQRQIDRVKGLIREAEEIEDNTFRENTIRDLQAQIGSIEEAFRNNELDYGRKLFLVENCIYGVDIQPIAIQIAKLRFFISLVIDQKVRPEAENLGIRPLPNLETKFVAANTLLSIEKPLQGILQNEDLKLAIEKKEHELKIVRERHFTARTPQTKEKYRREDERLRREIGSLLEQDNWSPETTAKLIKWNPYDQNTSAAFFDAEWMFGIRNGFNIVIGNPPYIRIQNVGEDVARILKPRFVSATGKFDIYVLFVEQSFKFMNNGGVTSFIHPHRFLTADYGRGLKKVLDNVKGLRSAICFGVEQVFDAATTYTGIFFYSFKNPYLKFKTANSQDFDKTPFVIKPYSEHGNHWVSATEDSSSSELIIKLRGYESKLMDVFEGVFQGVVTVGDDIFIMHGNHQGNLYEFYSNLLSRSIQIEVEIVRPLLKGENIRRYVQPSSEMHVFYPHYQDKSGKTRPYEEDDLRKHFPRAYNYIKEFRDLLVDKKIKYKTNPKYWFSLHRAREIRLFTQQKIITPQLQNYPNFTIDNEAWFPDAGGYTLIKKANIEKDYKFFLAVLNSRVLWYFIKNTSNPYSSNYYYFKTKYLEPFSFPQCSKQEEASLVKIVDQILAAKRRDPSGDTSRLEHDIDKLVYQLYDLSPNEIASIEATMTT
jgi:adenine-specific DNA-methyltransferase